MSLRDQILAADDMPRELVEVPEWGCSVYVGVMSGRNRDRLDCAIAGLGDGKKTLDNIRARVAAYTVMDESGVLVFGEPDIDVLGAKSAKALDRIFDVAQRLNGLRQEDLDAVKKG